MKVLSLFDGISCGRVALERAGIKVDEYYASEIDKHAIQIAKKNFPDTVHVGDVTKVDGNKFKGIDLLIGGSPCQGFSFAGKQLNFVDPRSRLFFEFVRILNEAKPRYFLLENVKMKKEYQDIITKYLGVEPIEINSALVSAQNRKRLYWTNIPGIEQPQDKKIMLVDVIDDGLVDRDKAYCLLESYSRKYATDSGWREYIKKAMGQLIVKEATIKGFTTIMKNQGVDLTFLNSKTRRGRKMEFKSNCLTYTKFDYCWFNGDDVRLLSPVECERLQTLPDNYTEGVDDRKRYAMLGNGWTVDVIAHIFLNIESKKVIDEAV